MDQWELERCNLNTGNFFSSLGSLVPTVWLALGSPHLVPKEYTSMRGRCPNFVYLWMTFPSSRKEDFIMITNSLLPWKSNQISLNEGDIVQAPTRRWWVKKNNILFQRTSELLESNLCSWNDWMKNHDYTSFSDTMNLNSWKHLLVTANSKRLLLHRDHFQSDWFYRLVLQPYSLWHTDVVDFICIDNWRPL